MSYSFAIRTLGTSAILRQELESLHRQTIKPDKIVVYIAEGYDRPNFSVGIEEYQWVPKGMVRQRVLRYEDIDSEYIFFLDDDVILAPNAAETLLNEAVAHSAYCIAPDTFRTHEMSFGSKVYAILTNLVFPRTNDNWAFKRNRNGSMTYNNNPSNGFYLSQTCDGPAWLCRKDVFLSLHLEDEVWLDRLGFPYGEDALETYKFYVNGYKVGVIYGDLAMHLDAKSSSGDYHKDSRKFYVRSFATFTLWWRMIYDNPNLPALERFYSCILFIIKVLWLLPINICASIAFKNIKIPYYYTKGVIDGWIFLHSNEYKKIPPYVLRNRNS